MPTYNKYEKYEEYENGQPTGVFVKGNLISTGEYSSIEECQGGGSSPSVPNPCGVENVVTYVSNDGSLSYSLNNGDYQTATGGTLDLGKDTSITWLKFNNTANRTDVTSIDLSRLCTENVTDMSTMFDGLEELSSINMEGWNTSKVKYFTDTFRHNKFTTVGISHFQTPSLVNTSGMFELCTNLQSVDMANFDMSSVWSIEEMFSGCSSLASVGGIENWNVSAVTDMRAVFFNCSSLTTLGLSSWDTTNATTVATLFNGCTSLQSLDLSNFSMQSIDLSNTALYSSMFYNCQSLNHIKCRQAFKDWCSSNKSAIALDNFDSITWEIVP